MPPRTERSGDPGRHQLLLSGNGKRAAFAVIADAPPLEDYPALHNQRYNPRFKPSPTKLPERPSRRPPPPSRQPHLLVGQGDLFQADGEGGGAQVVDRFGFAHPFANRAVTVAHDAFEAGFD